MRGIGTDASMRILEETIEKEDVTRLLWHDRFAKGQLSGTGSRQMEVFRRKLALNAPVFNETFLKKLPKRNAGAEEARKLAEHREKLETMGDNAMLVEMFPASEKEKRTLYHGFTKEERGRYKYLNRRHKTIPEQKFAFPIVSSWEYGWRLSDVIKKEDIRKPIHGRTSAIKDSFYTRNGVPTLPQPALGRSLTAIF